MDDREQHEELESLIQMMRGTIDDLGMPLEQFHWRWYGDGMGAHFFVAFGPKPKAQEVAA